MASLSKVSEIGGIAEMIRSAMNQCSGHQPTAEILRFMKGHEAIHASQPSLPFFENLCALVKGSQPVTDSAFSQSLYAACSEVINIAGDSDRDHLEAAARRFKRSVLGGTPVEGGSIPNLEHSALASLGTIGDAFLKTILAELSKLQETESALSKFFKDTGNATKLSRLFSAQVDLIYTMNHDFLNFSKGLKPSDVFFRDILADLKGFKESLSILERFDCDEVDVSDGIPRSEPQEELRSLVQRFKENIGNLRGHVLSLQKAMGSS